MKNATTHPTSESIWNAYHQNWLHTSTNTLYGLFHEHDGKRLRGFSLKKQDISHILPQKDPEEVTAIHFILGADDNKVCPFVTVCLGTHSRRHSVLQPILSSADEKPFIEHGASSIPYQFMQNLCQNWLLADNLTLAQSFEAVIGGDTGVGAYRRLNQYVLTAGNVNQALFDFMVNGRHNLTALDLYFGLDKNKWGDYARFGFSIVVACHYTSQQPDEVLRGIAMRGVKVMKAEPDAGVDSGYVALFEYISPCPPTCQ
ncbi:hypothetical protein AB9P05_19890 [Roseivirga sp. BDSF3-8]|uniref:hypothetical protein n=1 Tax=Roseivirga sp. BDSF3-8 TaxID=3241598 RepID=UPI0035319B79